MNERKKERKKERTNKRKKERKMTCFDVGTTVPSADHPTNLTVIVMSQAEADHSESVDRRKSLSLVCLLRQIKLRPILRRLCPCGLCDLCAFK